MCSPDDWRNFEATWYVKHSSGTDQYTIYGRGGTHNDSCACCGFAYKLRLFTDGNMDVAIETWHVHYQFFNKKSVTSSLGGRVVGLKFMCYDTPSNNKTVTCEGWLDDNNNNSWKKVFTWVDSGSSNDGGHCGTADNQVGLWGGPELTFRTDGLDYTFTKLSGREINPGGSFTDDTGGGDTGGGTGGGQPPPSPPTEPTGAGSGETPWLDGYTIINVTTGHGTLPPSPPPPGPPPGPPPTPPPPVPPTPPPPQPPPPPIEGTIPTLVWPTGKCVHGAMTDKDCNETVTAASISEFNSHVSKPIATDYFTDNWYNGIHFPAAKANICRDAGCVPYIRMQIWKTEGNTLADLGPYTHANIIAGDHDAALRQYARDAKAFGDLILLQYCVEVNGNWFPWFKEGATAYKNACKHVIDLFRDEKAYNVKWGWQIDATDNNNGPSWYPGDSYIDLVGSSMYGVFGYGQNGMASELSKCWSNFSGITANRPLAICEWGQSDADDTTSAFAAINGGSYNRIVLLQVWSEKLCDASDPYPPDGRPWANQACLTAYNNGLNNSHMTSTPPSLYYAPGPGQEVTLEVPWAAATTGDNPDGSTAAQVTRDIIDQILEAITNPVTEGISADKGWLSADNYEICDLCGNHAETTTGTFADGLKVPFYWHTATSKCVAPGAGTAATISENPTYTNHNGTTIPNPKIWLIFWGTTWGSQSAFRSSVIDFIQNKALVTDVAYWNNAKNDYTFATPVYSGAITHGSNPPANNQSYTSTDVINAIKGAITAGTVTNPTANTYSDDGQLTSQIIYCVIPDLSWKAYNAVSDDSIMQATHQSFSLTTNQV